MHLRPGPLSDRKPHEQVARLRARRRRWQRTRREPATDVERRERERHLMLH